MIKYIEELHNYIAMQIISVAGVAMFLFLGVFFFFLTCEFIKEFKNNFAGRPVFKNIIDIFCCFLILLVVAALSLCGLLIAVFAKIEIKKMFDGVG